MHYVVLANYHFLGNIIYFMHTVLVLMDVSYSRYQIVTLKSFVSEELETHVGSSVSDARCSVTTFVSMTSRLRRNMSAFFLFCSVMYST